MMRNRREKDGVLAMVTPATTINIINEERDPRDLMDTSMAIKVVKFGGSSLADAKQIQKAAAIIQADPQRRYVVPSAPGKRFSGDTKVTDMLYACYALAEAGVEFQKELEAIQARYDDIIAGLGIQLSLADEFAVIAENFRKRAGKDYAASRGEYLNGKVIATYLGFPFVDAADVIFFQPNGSLDDQKTEEALREVTSQIVDAVHSVLERTPPELAADIADRGIVLTGGGALLHGLEDLIEENTGITTMTAEEPLTAVAIGTGKYIEFLSERK